MVICPLGNELKNPPTNYTHILINGKLSKLQEGKVKFICKLSFKLTDYRINSISEQISKSFNEVDDSPLLKFFDMLDKVNQLDRYIVSHPKVQKLLHSEEKFDLVISELALNEAMLGKIIYPTHNSNLYTRTVLKIFINVCF